MNRCNLKYWILILVIGIAFSCSKKDNKSSGQPPTETDDSLDNDNQNPSDSSDTDSIPPFAQGKMPEEVSPDIRILQHGTKIEQLTGDFDRERQEPTQNQTFSTYQLKETDLGVPFRFENRTYILFGDTHGGQPGLKDAIAYTTDTNPEDGLALTFLQDDNNVWLPITIPRVSLEAFEVPTEGIELNHKMYIYATTGHRSDKTMGKSVLARSYDKGHTFDNIYILSAKHFINVSIVKTPADKYSLLPKDMSGEVLVMFGSGNYRQSDVYLACQPASKIEDRNSIRYFAGIDERQKPVWSTKEDMAVPLFDQPQVGELSVTYNRFIDRWIMLYNAGDPRGINMRTAKKPWGPWTEPQLIFRPWEDDGYCHFMHTSWGFRNCDNVSDPGRENEWGGEYGPYQYPYFAKGDAEAAKPYTTIYFNMSTWNPYQVVLMKAKLERN